MIKPIGQVRKAIREQNVYRPSPAADRKVIQMGNGITRTVPLPDDKFI